MAKQDRRGGGPTDTKKDELPKAKLSLANFKRSMRLFSYLGKQKWKFVLGMIFLVGSAGVGLVFPLKSGQMLGYLAENGMPVEQVRTELMTIGLVLLTILVLQAAFSFGRVYFFAQVTENVLKAVRQDTFKRLVQMPMSFFSKNQVAELSSRMATDISVISDAFTVTIAELIRQSIVGIGGLILLITTSGPIAKWFLVIIPPLTFFAILFARKIRKFSKTYQDKIAESNVVVGEALTGITNVKTFTNEEYEIKKYNNLAESIRVFGLRFGIFRGLFFSFVMIFVFGSVFFILWQMLFALKVDKTLTPEAFGTFMMLSLFVAGSLGGLPEQIASLQRALGATDRVFELIDGDIESIEFLQDNIPAKHTRGEIQFQNISFNYPSRPDFTVLKNVDFKVEAGQTVALVGSSGSGKTTIASLILRFYDPTSGTVLIDGVDNKSISLTELRKQIALVPQDVILFAGSIRDNIAYGRPNASDADIEEAARKANAYDFITSFPDQFKTLVGERGIQLSGGQRQRIAIARAVLKNPSILILDEATSSLDSESERLVQEALDKLMIGRTSVVIAHRLATIKKADKIIVLQNGTIQETGTHQELIQNDQGLYHKLSKMQFELS